MRKRQIIRKGEGRGVGVGEQELRLLAGQWLL